MELVKRRRYFRNDFELYAGITDLLLTLPTHLKTTKAVDVGSYIGESANIFSLFFSEVICIDPMENQEVKLWFLENTAGRNISLIQKTSDAGHPDLLYEGYGLVYIDAVHTFEQVTADIRNYWSKVKEDGYIGGHDYYAGPESEGVVKAVNKIFVQPDFVFVDGSWLVKKTIGRARF